MAHPALSGRPILVAVQASSASTREVVTRLRAMEHISPILIPAAAFTSGDVITRLIASQVWQVFQNGDDAVLAVDDGPAEPEAISEGSARATTAESRDGDERLITRLAASVVQAVVGSGESTDLVLAGEGLAAAVLNRLGIADGTSVDTLSGGIPIVRAAAAPVFFVRIGQADPAVLAEAVERLRHLDPDRLALRPY